MSLGTVHIVGAGLAGLSAALTARDAGWRVFLYEAAPQAGGRCRSYEDKALGALIDNGNHMIFSANRAALDFLDRIGGRGEMIEATEPRFPYLDLESGREFVLRPNLGGFPWWIFGPNRRLPGSGPLDYLALAHLMLAGRRQRVGDIVGRRSPIYRTLIEPLSVAALNIAPEEGSAWLLGRMIAESFGRGGAACRPLVARESLSAALIDPALVELARVGVEVKFGARLRQLHVAGDRATALDFGQTQIAVAPDERVILALPVGVASEFLPMVEMPRRTTAILNAHFRLPQSYARADGSPYLALVGGLAQWLFFRRDVVSVTVSAADAVIDEPAEVLAARLWGEVARAIGRRNASLPPYRIVKEKLATFAQTPDEVARRPAADHTPYGNLFLAGDWTDTGLPATIEGAIRSGKRAAELATG